MTVPSMCAFFAIAALACACSRPAANTAAQETSSERGEPCTQLTSQAELTRCWTDEATRAERRITALQGQITTALDSNDPDSVALFDRAHQRWESYRAAHCEAVARLSEGGSAAPLQEAHCQARLGAVREAELQSILKDLSR